MSGGENEPICVLIADGDPLVCRGLARLLHDAADIAVVATASDAVTALALAAQLQPQVALVDVGSAMLGGMELTRRLHSLYPQLHIVVLGIYATFSTQALAAGACRFLLKDCGRDKLVSAIRLAARADCLAAAAPHGVAPAR